MPITSLRRVDVIPRLTALSARLGDLFPTADYQDTVDAARDLLEFTPAPDDTWNDIDRACAISRELTELRGARAELRASFKQRPLDGGQHAADTHPLMVKLDLAIVDAHEQLRSLV